MFRCLIESILLSLVEPTWPELVNPCYSGNHDCDTTAQCIPLEGQAFQCQCATGYRGDGRNCYGLCMHEYIQHPVQQSSSSSLHPILPVRPPTVLLIGTCGAFSWCVACH